MFTETWAGSPCHCVNTGAQITVERIAHLGIELDRMA